MPTYVYRCKSCEHQFETIQKIKDDPLTECPKCKGQLMRLLFPPSIVFKGSGFHINDYPSSGNRGAAPAAKSAEKSAGEKTESATAAKAEPKESATATKE
jgi:putative FmdB family regulatory protein